jgi:flagellar basal-body rod protein FlgC
MSSFKVFDIAGSGMSAQSVRLNTVASNLANADSVSGDPNTVYRAKHPVFQAVMSGSTALSAASSASVNVMGIAQSQAAPELRYDPGNPLADAQGNVYVPNVNVVEEMADMISASRSYQNNVEVLNTTRDMLLQTLKLGQ